MSRTKRKDIDELHKLRKELKEKDTIIKSLERQIANLNKEFELEIKEKDLIEEIELKKDKCPKCKKGKIKLLDLGPKMLQTCTECTYRSTKNNG